MMRRWRQQRWIKRQLRDLDQVDWTSLEQSNYAPRVPLAAHPGAPSGNPRRRTGTNPLVVGLSIVAMGGLGLYAFAEPLGLDFSQLSPASEGELGDGTEYAFMQRQDVGRAPVSYPACQELDVVINPHPEMPSSAEAMVKAAAQRISNATGLRFRITGTTDRRFGDDLDRDTVLVDWTDPSAVSRLKGDVAGLAGSRAESRYGGPARYVWGSMALDAPDLAEIEAEQGFDHATAIVLHEFGHVVGLDHVPARNQLMHAENVGLTELQAGDLAGLRRLGSPC